MDVNETHFYRVHDIVSQWLSGLGADGADLRSLGSGRAVL